MEKRILYDRWQSTNLVQSHLLAAIIVSYPYKDTPSRVANDQGTSKEDTEKGKKNMVIFSALITQS